MATRRTDVHVDRGEAETPDVLVTDTDDFFGNRNGLTVIRDLFPQDYVTGYDGGFEYRAGNDVISLRAYQDPNSGVWRVRIGRSGQQDMNLTGGVISTLDRSTDARRVAIIEPSRHSAHSIVGGEITSRQGIVRVGDLRVLTPPVSDNPEVRLLRNAVNKANMQRMRRGHF